ncbi:MAG: hypothetical protein HY782_08215 [Chloroflexi bacterium]|nr:hypothetical protein [Chloroflexota bacterium]
MTWQQIYDARAAGQSLSDVAKSKGIGDQKLIDAMVAGQLRRRTQNPHRILIKSLQVGDMLGIERVTIDYFRRHE